MRVEDVFQTDRLAIHAPRLSKHRVSPERSFRRNSWQRREDEARARSYHVSYWWATEAQIKMAEREGVTLKVPSILKVITVFKLIAR